MRLPRITPYPGGIVPRASDIRSPPQTASSDGRLETTTGAATHAARDEVTPERGAPPGGVPTPTPTATPSPTPAAVAPPTLSETYAYDRLGNLRVKAGVGYEYPAARQPRPHAPIRVGGQPYAYDANGNLTSGGGRTFVWNGWNQLAGVSQAGLTETYTYDAAGARVTRTSNGATVVTVADLWERTVGGATTHFYRFGADIIGVRRSDQGTLYLFSDHLGSVSAATTASGTLVGMQHYDPWGRVRTGGIGLTARTFTGQRLDATGLLYYHARYYDPTLGRFISPDSIVPEPGNPQSFNRFAYVYNNPLKYTDPTGHWIESAVDIAFIAYDIWDITQNGLTWDNGLALAADVGGLLLPGLTGLGMAVRGGRALARTDDILDMVRAVSWTERFAGASPEVRRGVAWLEKMVQDERIPDSYRRGFAAELLRAEEYYKAGKLQAVEAVVEGGRVDLLLVTDDIVEVKYWTQSHTAKNIDELARQLTRYQATGRPILLELFRTKTDPITEGYIEDLLKALQTAGVKITREQIRLVEWP
ncbi:RHS repeat-associated core domain-containing protein [Roseiflexus sp. RS-1]|uniref:RHS repeat-associated core domain-containing protein n=1 Tax=Roseiflexus sp. (strain RS-1) TaxID=357808 RepID=UPI000673D278|nr:RHS repeat-associated core domain-containing protein [Roseiflexus sp. RS-1]